MRVYLRDGSAQTILRATTRRYKLQIQLSISPIHSILTPGQPVPALSPITPGAWQGSHWRRHFLSHWYDLTREKIPPEAGFELWIFRSRGGRLTTTGQRGGLQSQERLIIAQCEEDPTPSPSGESEEVGFGWVRHTFLRVAGSL